jgi:hypothetical protein
MDGEGCRQTKVGFHYRKRSRGKKLASHKASVAAAMALPLILLGNISESATQVTGPGG